MVRDEQSREVDRNYDVFQRRLGSLLPVHQGEYALMRSGEIVAFFATVGEAYQAATDRFGEGPFSIQEVTDEPIDLGFFSHVAH